MSDITEKVNALCSNAESLKQCLTDLETMVKYQAHTITSLENTNKKLIQGHDEEIVQLTLKLTEKDKKLSEVTVENTNLHSSIAHLRKSINYYEEQLQAQCESVVSLQKTNSGLLNYQEEIAQLKLLLTKKDIELREVVANNQILISKVKSQEEDIAINGMCNTNLLSITDVFDKIKELKEREGEIEQLRFKLTETRQKLRDETKKYDELLKSSRKPRVKGGDDLSNQPMEELKSRSHRDEDCEFQDEVIEDINTYTQIKKPKMSIGIGGHGKEDNSLPRKQRKIKSCGAAPVVSSDKESMTVIVNPLELEETKETSRVSGSVTTITSGDANSSFDNIQVTQVPDEISYGQPNSRSDTNTPVQNSVCLDSLNNDRSSQIKFESVQIKFHSENKVSNIEPNSNGTDRDPTVESYPREKASPTNLCSICEKSFPTESELANHMKSHTGEKSVRTLQIDMELPAKRCSTPENEMTPRSRMSGTVMSMSSESLDSPLLDIPVVLPLPPPVELPAPLSPNVPRQGSTKTKGSSDSKSSKTKKRNLSSQQNFKCDGCDKSFRQNEDLKKHKRVHTGEKPYECTLCEKRFSQMGTLRIHTKLHTGEKPFACDLCEKRFVRSDKLSLHKEISHIHPGEKLYKCTVCEKSYKYSSDLSKHKRIHHTGEKPHVCSLCEKSFESWDKLSFHKSMNHTHTREKSYKCSVCDKTFFRNSYLTVHKRTHTGERPFMCEECGQSFKSTSNLAVHKRIHIGDKPCKCAVCEMSFTTSGQLIHHRKMKH